LSLFPLTSNVLTKINDIWHKKSLAKYFSGEQVLARVKKSERFQKWFTDIASTIQSLDFKDATATSRKMQQLMQALEEVESFEQVHQHSLSLSPSHIQ
jgi:hypothetical protein